MLTNILSSKKTPRLMVIATAAIAIVAAFFLLALAPVGNHEAYVGVSADNMLKNSEWVVPIFNSQLRLQKTPLNYWFVAAAGKVLGGVNEFCLRLPNAFLAVVSAIAIIFFVKQWAGLSAAVISAIIWSTSLGYIRYSHTGRPEMSLAVLVTIAMLSFFAGIKTQSRKEQICYMLVFWLSFALAMLAKGPAPLPLLVPPLFFYIAIFRKWKKIPSMLPIVGVIIFLAVVLPWPIAVLLKSPQALEIWKAEFLGRAAGDYASGGKPFYYYFRAMFALFVPWSGFIPAAIAAPFYRVWERKQKPMYYLWLWFVVSVVAMTLCGGKRQHYILAAMPAMAILTGVILDDMLFIRKAYTKIFVRNFLCIYAVALVATAIAGTVWLGKQGKTISHDAAVKSFALETSEIINKKDEKSILTAYCKANPSFIYYFKRPVPVEADLAKIREIYNNGGYISATGDYMDKLENQEGFTVIYRGLDSGRAIFKK
ncbi:MAG: glycosyltransferase family 39 protein [Anaerohalosphaeraceae bacterium]|nr:glycosyltransferase family 39 protein [Anaerohalosphaeraceae bacterium]